MKEQLQAGKAVVITSDLLQAMEGEGIEGIVELRLSPMAEPDTSFLAAFGSGAGTDLGKPQHAILFPQIRHQSQVAIRMSCIFFRHFPLAG